MADPSSGTGAGLPAGTLTFVLTDVEGSTALWEAAPEPMRAALARHDALIARAVERHGGVVMKARGEGDSVFAVFVTASEGVAAALAIHRALGRKAWPTPRPVRVRIGVHSGEVQLRDGDYYGATVNRGARLRAIGHGGQTLLSEATAALVRDTMPEGATLADLGLHRLKDLTRPERVFQLTADDLPSEFPPLRGLDVHRHNLEIQPTPFVGREREIAGLRKLLVRDDPSAGPSRAGISFDSQAPAERKYRSAERHRSGPTPTSGQARLVTLTGPGGTGKTRLAMQVAAELSEAFPDGVLWVDLAPISDPALVISAIAQTLDVVDTGGRPLLDAVIERLRAARLLLLLDNFEQVLDAASVVDGLLRDCPGLVLIVTSRAPLQLRVEHEFPVPPLSLPDVAQSFTPEALSQYEAVALFVERACAIRPDFVVTNANAPAVAEICARLDGLPLAIELAAARLRMLSPEAMLPRLGHGLSLLTGGRRDLPARQQTLGSTIAWSYGLLDPVEQQTFRRLSVFVGGFTLDAAEAVAGNDARALDVVDAVERLVAQSLVQIDRETGPEPRCRMLETIREYALEQLEASGEGPAVRDRHLAWCADLAQRAARDLGGPDQAVWLNRLDEEHDNMRAALRWAASTGDPGSLGVRLASDLGRNFWAMHGHHREGRAWLDRLLSLAPARSDARAQALRAAGRLALRQNDYPAASAAFGEALAIFRALGDRYGTAQTLSWFGVVPHHLGRYDEAQAMLEESLAISREIGNSGEESIALRFLADLAQDRGDLARAARRYEASLALARARQVPHDIAYALRGLGHVARAQGQYALAGERLRESLTLLKPLRDRRCIPLCLEGLACLAVGPDWAERTARLFGVAHALQATTGAPAPPSELADYQRTEADARASLGAERFAAAWGEGAALSLEDAIEYALSDDPARVADLGRVPVGAPGRATGAQVASVGVVDAAPDEPPGSPRAQDVPLSAREREVVGLIAAGLSNRQIAERLVLSVRTVERHIENVYNRLGISGKAGRAIVTAYALRHYLAEPA